MREYTDEATAKNGERDGFKQMWADVARHRFDLLLFWSLDRLTREGTYKTLTYLRRLTDAGVKFKSYTEQYIDSLGVFGEAIIGVLAAVAAQERIRISERTKAGLARTRARGTRLGRPKPTSTFENCVDCATEVRRCGRSRKSFGLVQRSFVNYSIGRRTASLGRQDRLCCWPKRQGAVVEEADSFGPTPRRKIGTPPMGNQTKPHENAGAILGHTTPRERRGAAE